MFGLVSPAKTSWLIFSGQCTEVKRQKKSDMRRSVNKNCLQYFLTEVVNVIFEKLPANF